MLVRADARSSLEMQRGAKSAGRARWRMNRGPVAPNLRQRMMDRRQTALDLNSWAMNRGPD